MLQFNDVLELADTLPIDEREDLVEILHNRIREQKREQLLRDIQESEREFRNGEFKAVTPDELMKEILE